MNNLEARLELRGTNMPERRLVTAALPYINNIPHLGHIVGSHLPADIFARYCRSKGYETLFVGGTDEHGSTSEIAASTLGIPINTFAKKLHEEHRKIYQWFGISYDIFSRTSTPLHRQTTQTFFNEIYNNGFVKEGKMEVFYSPKDSRFLPDRYVIGTCAYCGYDKATGDQCEKCTKVLDTKELINPHSTVSGGKVELRETNHLFLQLDKLAPQLEAWIKKQNWRSQVSSLALGWINEGLQERCITRDLKHGIPVPVKGFEDKVFYVWFDAPIGYLSFTQEARPDEWEKYWKDKNGKVYHFLGKDNIPFHTIFWPGMLLAHGNLNLPHNVIGLQYLNYEGGKFSKSRKRGVFCEHLPDTGIDRDIFRAYLTFLIPENADTEFRWDDFQTRINSDIIGNYGNFVNRTLSFLHSKLGGEVHQPKKEEVLDKDRELYENMKRKVKKITSLLEETELRKAFTEILALSSIGNKYFNDNAPWEAIKKDRERATHIVYHCANLSRTLAILTAPYLPDTSQKVWQQLNLEGKVDEKGRWDTATQGPEEYNIGKPSIIFKPLKEEDINSIKKVTSDVRELKELF